MAPAATGTRYLSLSEAANVLGVHPKTLRRKIADGKITAYRVGTRRIVIKAEDLESLLEPIPAAS